MQQAHAKIPDACRLLGASVQLELQRVGVGHLESKMPPVSQRYICSRRMEWLREWGWMAGMGGQEGGAPRRNCRLNFAAAWSLLDAPASPAARRVRRFWGGEWSWEEVLGRGGEGLHRLMWTLRVEWERASLHSTKASPRAGGWKFAVFPHGLMQLGAGRSDFLWAPYTTPASVCGSWRDVKP